MPFKSKKSIISEHFSIGFSVGDDFLTKSVFTESKMLINEKIKNKCCLVLEILY